MSTDAVISRMADIAAERRTVRCGQCLLVQFETRSGDCRKCHEPLFPASPVAEDTEPVVSNQARLQGLSLPVVSLPDRLRLLRQARGLSQRDLAAKMGVPRTYVSKLENGKATPTLTSLARFAQALGTTIPHLLSEPKDAFLAEIERLTPRLSAAQRDEIVSRAHVMAYGCTPEPLGRLA